MGIAAWDDDFTTALVRLVELLDDPLAIDLLGAGRLRELFFAIVQGPAVPMVNSLGGVMGNLGGVLDHIRNNLAEPLSVDDLAAQAGLSRAAFDRHFKATTTLSPLQYIKALRLNTAAAFITTGVDISHAAAQVGYLSPSQFSREFKRQFRSTPRQWAVSGAADSQAARLVA